MSQVLQWVVLRYYNRTQHSRDPAPFRPWAGGDKCCQEMECGDQHVDLHGHKEAHFTEPKLWLWGVQRKTFITAEWHGERLLAFKVNWSVVHITLFAIIYYTNPKPREKKKGEQAPATFLKLPKRNYTLEKDIKPLPWGDAAQQTQVWDVGSPFNTRQKLFCPGCLGEGRHI